MSKQHPAHPISHKHNLNSHESCIHDKGHDHHEHKHKETDKLEFLINLLKKILQTKPNDGGLIKGDFKCPQARYFNKKINETRQGSGSKTLLNEDEHNPEFTKEEQSYAIKEIAKDIAKDSEPLKIVSQKPNEIIYGNTSNQDEQIKYTFSDGKWLITPGKSVSAIIIDVVGKIIEIKPGPHIHQYGEGGNFIVAGACKGHHEDHLVHKQHLHDHQNGHHKQIHKNPSSNPCGHGAKCHEHHHHNAMSR